MLDRRAFLLTSAAAGAATALPARAAPVPGESPDLAALFDALFEEGLRARPEGATQLGLDKGPNADLRGKLSDASDAGRAADKALTHDQLQRLALIDRSRLSRRPTGSTTTSSATPANRRPRCRRSTSAAAATARRPMSSASRPGRTSRSPTSSTPSTRSTMPPTPTPTCRG